MGLGYWLGVRLTRRDEIRRQYSTHLQRSTAVINHFLELHPDASWRALVTALDGMKETKMADRLRHCCEPLTGIYMYIQVTLQPKLERKAKTLRDVIKCNVMSSPL